jgi:hypothetical protein
LGDLETCDPFLPPNADASGALEVVPIHDDMDHEVEGNGNPGNGGQAYQLSIAKEGSGAMMVSVKECYSMSAYGPTIPSLSLLSGFFLRNKKTVSINSTYLVR